MRRGLAERLALGALQLLLAAFVLLPFFWMVSVSLKPPTEPFAIPARLWPDEPTLAFSPAPGLDAHSNSHSPSVTSYLKRSGTPAVFAGYGRTIAGRTRPPLSSIALSCGMGPG